MDPDFELFLTEEILEISCSLKKIANQLEQINKIGLGVGIIEK
jgi:hypothetical protein